MACDKKLYVHKSSNLTNKSKLVWFSSKCFVATLEYNMNIYFT